jgi:uncharacterized protein
MPTFYQCDRCTACCRWPGEVKLTKIEIDEIAGFLDLTTDDFIKQYTRLRSTRRGLALTEKPNEECIFLKNNACQINPVKPKQCREFPNLWNFPGFEEVCQAKPIELDESEYQTRIAQSLQSNPFRKNRTRPK